MSIVLYLCGALALAFSALCFVPSGDIAISGFILSLGASFIVLWLARRFIASPTRGALVALRKVLEYLPFILFAGFILRRAGEAETGFLLDLFTALLWIACTVLAFWLIFRLSDKRIESLYPGIGLPPSSTKAVWDGKRIVWNGLEWADALLQAACLVLLINLFFFQLYAIPSESMVSEFMIGDRVFVLKTPSGPKFPLSNVGIPRMRTYDRGDIIVFSNPHYNDTKEARIRSFTSQLVYMLTFTAVNINKDEFGSDKADPLVKRITGVPGEKLMLVDGVLYARRAGTDWSVVEEDATWAKWNLSALPRSELALVQNKGLSKDEFMLLESIESKRANLDLDSAAAEARDLVKRFATLRKSPDTVNEADSLIPEAKRELYTLFSNSAEYTRVLLTTNGGFVWFRDFMTEWTQDTGRKNLFEERSRNMNVMLKLAFGKLVVRNAELIAANSTEDQFRNDAVRREIMAEVNDLSFYMGLHDQRNMFEFPQAQDEYIPQDSFFMMGDNRFNSLDMRHSYMMRLSPVDPADPLSFRYRSNLEPQFVPVSRILGTATFRFWPLSRAGVPQ